MSAREMMEWNIYIKVKDRRPEMSPDEMMKVAQDITRRMGKRG